MLQTLTCIDAFPKKNNRKLLKMLKEVSANKKETQRKLNENEE
jgi:hypothetical protein